MTRPDALHILLIEDQHSIAKNIAGYLEQKGHSLDFACNGLQGVELALQQFYDLIILDLNLPMMDGLQVCQQLRLHADRQIPIIMLTARDSIEDKISGFHAGADDYLTKPFSLEELEVRCLALSRRHLLQRKESIVLGPLLIDKKRKTVSREGLPLELHTMGYKILLLLAEAYPRVVSRSELSHQLWRDEPTESDALRSHIYQLRTVLDKPFATPLLKTIFGVGFTLEIDHIESR